MLLKTLRLATRLKKHRIPNKGQNRRKKKNVDRFHKIRMSTTILNSLDIYIGYSVDQGYTFWFYYSVHTKNATLLRGPSTAFCISFRISETRYSEINEIPIRQSNIDELTKQSNVDTKSTQIAKV